MPNVFYVFWIMLGALIAFLMIMYFMMGQTSTTLTANTLNDAVHSSIEYARDNSMRASRGAYVINVPKFENRLNEYKIKDLSGFHVANDHNNNEIASKDMFAIRFLKDNSTNTKDNNDWINAEDYPSKQEGNTPVDIPVRMVQVQAIPNKHILKEGSLQDQWSNAIRVLPSRKYVSTYAVDVQDNKQNPVKEPNLHEHSKADLTDNEYTDEGNQHEPVSSKTSPLSSGEM